MVMPEVIEVTRGARWLEARAGVVSAENRGRGNHLLFCCYKDYVEVKNASDEETSFLPVQVDSILLPAAQLACLGCG